MSARGFRLFNLPDIVGLEELREVVVLLLAGDLIELGVDGVVVGGSLHVADHAEGDGEAVLRGHHGELQLQGVVLAVGVVNV